MSNPKHFLRNYRLMLKEIVTSLIVEDWVSVILLSYLVDIMVIKNAVKVLVDFVEHIDHLHGGAVVAEGGESHNITEIDGDLLKQLWLHTPRFLQGTHHWAMETQREWKM